MRNLLKHIIIIFVIMLVGGSQCAFTMESKSPQTMTIICIDDEVREVPVSIMSLCGFFRGQMEFMADVGDASGTVNVAQSRSATSALIELLRRAVPSEVQNGFSVSLDEQKGIQDAIKQDLAERLLDHSLESYQGVVLFAELGDFFGCDVVQNGTQEVIADYVSTAANRNYFFSNPDYYKNIMQSLDKVVPGVRQGIEDLLIGSQSCLVFSKEYRLQGSRVISVAWRHDGKQLASGLGDHTIRICDAEPGTQIQRFDGHENWVVSVAWRPDGKQLASSSIDGSVKIWDVDRGVQIKILEGHADVVASVAWKPDGKQLASGSRDHTVRIWDVDRGVQIKILEGHADAVDSVAWKPDGKQIASGSHDYTVRIWDVERGVQIQRLDGPKCWVISVAWRPDGKQLASGSGDHTIKIWDVEAGTEIQRLNGHTGWLNSVAWRPDGKQLASCSYDHTVRIWDVERGTQIQRLDGHTGWVNSVAWRPDGKQLASGSCDKTIKIWKLHPKKFTEFLSLFQLAFYVLLRNSVDQQVIVSRAAAYMLTSNEKEKAIVMEDPAACLYKKGYKEDVHILGDLYADMQCRIDEAQERGDLSAEELKEFKDSLQHVRVEGGP